MKHNYTALLVITALALTLAPAAGSAQDEPVQRTWSPFTAPDGSFSVLLPGQPAEQKNETPVEDGKTVATTTYTLNLGPEGFFYVAYTENPGLTRSEPGEAFDGLQAELAKAGTVLANKDIQVAGFPGRELEVEMTAKNPGDVLTTARFFIVNDRLYQMLVTGQKQLTSSENQHKFLDSFQLLKKE